MLRFCLGPDDSGSVEVADDGAALVTIAPAEPSIGVRTFEATTFDAALRMAVDAGLLKAACVEKQILFLEGGASRSADAPVAAPPAPVSARPVPEVDGGDVGAPARDAERARHVRDRAASSGRRIFRRELPRQRERMDARRERFLSLWREVVTRSGLAGGPVRSGRRLPAAARRGTVRDR